MYVVVAGGLGAVAMIGVGLRPRDPETYESTVVAKEEQLMRSHG